ncbi:winged helix-turn-helix domain-containing protein [Pseudarthrobacter raffinosi]|uniref:winged helix-turn-helix domain-containing protein n=1 Tax=Pseudarthrobacter raffinosi TaxID=2953651 RepID=UPI00208E1F34|nr:MULTISPECIES: winged helix-turn-helix domain-containing protein [unclassified Pseudarthrobacter]MCO4239636.1 winged helix-turn-helix domain-containing protein [Pseudarthrobacter sp. MDT3-28]MCO4265002.1 winged helix-turn-helix domain-containing protein [Pseudarthrobacter sp. MDT3-26]
MAVNVHAPYPRPRTGSRPGAHPGAWPGLQPGLQPRGLAVWLQPCEGQDIDPAVWAQAAKAVLARARRLAPEAEVHLWTAAGTSGVEDSDASEVSDVSDVSGGGTGVSGTAVSETARDAGPGPAAVDPPVSLAGRRSILAVDLAADTVLLDGAPVSFTHMEFSLLRYLVENQSRTIQREELQRVLESLDCPGAAFRSIDVYVGRVRRKLGSARHAIATVRGGGYQFVPGPGSTVRGPAEYCI